MQGRVASFDEEKGFGYIDTEDGRRLFFHCTQIADGSRTIQPGTPVTFKVVAGHQGRWEAAAVSAPAHSG